MTLKELEIFLRGAKSPSEVFKDDLDGTYREYALICHPDRNPGEEELAKEVFQLLETWKAKAIGPKAIVRSPTRSYEVRNLIAAGDISDVYAAGEFVLKVSRSKRDGELISKEAQVIEKLRTHPKVGTFTHYLPKVEECFSVREKGKSPRQILAMRNHSDYITLVDVIAQHPEGLGPRTLVWIFKRLLSILGYIHEVGYVHGAVLPTHVLIHPGKHNIKLIDWTLAVSKGENLKMISTAYKNWYPPEVFAKTPVSPASDIFMAAGCICYLSGGNLQVPRKIYNFLDTCLVQKQISRPDRAWDLSDDFSVLAQSLYGPPRFVSSLTE